MKKPHERRRKAPSQEGRHWSRNSEPGDANADVAFRLSAACTKSAVGALVLSLVAFGITQKFIAATLFNAFGTYVGAREALAREIENIKADPCWRTHSSSIDGSNDLNDLPPTKLTTVVCQQGTPQPSVPALPNPPPATASAPRPNGASVKSSAPMPPASLTVSFAVPLVDSDELAQIRKALEALWDDKAIDQARKYGDLADWEIYYWLLVRNRTFMARVNSSALADRKSDWKPAELALLTISDIEAINSPGRTSAEEIVRIMRQEFRMNVPNSSIGISLGTAALITSLSISLFLTMLSAYLRTARATNAFFQQGSVFEAILGSAMLELTMLVDCNV